MPSLLVLVGAALLGACTPCQDVCRAETRHYERCLGEWGMDWIDVGALDKVDYRRTCVDETSVWLDGLTEDASASERATCQGLLNDLGGTPTCDAVWQALVDYGSAE